MSDLKKLQRRLEKARNNPKERYTVLEDLAGYYLNKEKFEDSLKYYEDTLIAAQELQDQAKIAKAHRMIGEVMIQLARHDEAIKHTKLYTEYAVANGTLVEQQRALTTLGRTYFVKTEDFANKNSPKCRKMYKLVCNSLWKSIHICAKLEKEKSVTLTEICDMRARSMLNLGLAYDGLNKCKDAEEQFYLAMRMCKAKKLESALLRLCCISLASFLIRQGKSVEALRYYKEAAATLKSTAVDDSLMALAEIHMGESEAYLELGEIHSARKVLQKAYRLNSPLRDTVAGRLRIVAGIEFTQKKIDEMHNMSIEEKSRHYETIGDGFCKLKAYRLALYNYEEMLKCCEATNYNLQSCYFSLAQTCNDLKKYEDAISYYEKELLYCTPESACNTLLFIVKCEELLDVPSTKKLETLERALKMAEKANDLEVKKKVLKKLLNFQKDVNSTDVEQTQDKLNALSKCTSDSGSDSEGEVDLEQCTPTIGDTLDLDALSDSSYDEDEEGFVEKIPTPRPKRNVGRKTQVNKWKNEKGETRLHVACIAGKISTVRTLLEQGYNVNATDHAGWTPLHEACNFGHKDIVELLLENGAEIDHRGGPGTGGLTPLHDAAEGGNFDIMEFLLDKGASVNIYTKQGESIIDSLKAYYNRACLTPEEKLQYHCIEDRVQLCLAQASPQKCTLKPVGKSCDDRGHSFTKTDGNNLASTRFPGSLRRSLGDDDVDLYKKRSKRDISPVSSLRSSSSSRVSDISDKVSEEEAEGVSEYVKAIQSVRKNNVAHSSPEVSRKPLAPLIAENEVVDNWLEDDLQPCKKRRKSDQNKSSLSNSYRPLPVKKKSVSRLSLNSSRASSVSSAEAQEETRLSSGSVNSDNCQPSTPLGWQDDECVQMFESDNHDYWTSNFTAPNVDPWSNQTNLDVNQSPLTTRGVNRPIVNSTMSSQQIVPVVNVRVESRLLAIPVQDLSVSIGWLAKEAAKRHKVDGCMPVLSIYSLEGALYSEEDHISSVIGREVNGIVDSWNIPPITVRYKDACQTLSLNSEQDILSLLDESQETNAVEIIDRLYKMHILKPVFRAMSMELNLSKINLANNMLNDEGVCDLCDHIGKLSQLKELDLSGNNISVLGFKELVIASKKQALKNLQDLNLSHNYLTDASSPYLVDLTASLPALECLSLADCFFTKSVVQKQFLTLNKLQSLDLSSNELQADGLGWFLGLFDLDKERYLNPERLQHLCLLGLKGKFLSLQVMLFLKRGSFVALKELHLSYSAFKDEDVTQLLSVLFSASELHTLRLPTPLNIPVETICQFLLRQPPLKIFDIHNLETFWEKSEERDMITSAIQHAANTSLERLTLRYVPKMIQEAWVKERGLRSVVKRGAVSICILTN